MNNNQVLYEERLNRLLTTCNHQEPDRVPILSIAETYCISYAGSTVEECLADETKEFEVFAKFHRDVYMDVTFGTCINRAMKVFDTMGNNAYFVSRDGVTIQHKEIAPMEASEYPELINDPVKFGKRVLLPRKYPVLNKPYLENYEEVKKAVFEFVAYTQKMDRAVEYAKVELALPTLIGAAFFAPLDFIMDYCRGFRGIQLDLRRSPELVLEAVEALLPLMIGMATRGSKQLQPFPFGFTPLHIPTFLGPKQFGKFYWPTYKKLLLAIHQMGGKVFAFLEGDWHNFYEFLQELPKSLLIGGIEKDDMATFKQKLGHVITLAGGMPVSLLKMRTKQECLDYAKQIIDICAPGGGFIFANDKSLISPADVNIDNLIAVNEFVREYGKY